MEKNNRQLTYWSKVFFNGQVILNSTPMTFGGERHGFWNAYGKYLELLHSSFLLSASQSIHPSYEVLREPYGIHSLTPAVFCHLKQNSSLPLHMTSERTMFPLAHSQFSLSLGYRFDQAMRISKGFSQIFNKWLMLLTNIKESQQRLFEIAFYRTAQHLFPPCLKKTSHHLLGTFD